MKNANFVKKLKNKNLQKLLIIVGIIYVYNVIDNYNPKIVVQYVEVKIGLFLKIKKHINNIQSF